MHTFAWLALADSNSLCSSLALCTDSKSMTIIFNLFAGGDVSIVLSVSINTKIFNVREHPEGIYFVLIALNCCLLHVILPIAVANKATTGSHAN